MEKNAKLFGTIVLSAIIVCGLAFVSSPKKDAANGSVEKTTVVDVGADKDPQKKIRILIVPGHEPRSGGTSYRGMFERDLTVSLALELRDYLQADGRYEPVLTRDTQGWNPVFKTYFNEHWDDVIAWRDAAKSKMASRLASGEVQKPRPPVEHKTADDDVSVQLYAFNKWANENGIDLMLHVHFNEHRERPGRTPGPNSGFSTYMPAPQFGNSAATRPIVEKVFGRLARYDAVSDLWGESTGIVEDSDLIAVSGKDAIKVPSILVEYGYIYEGRFTDPKVQVITIKDLAYQTFLGLRDAFGHENVSDRFGTSVLPHAWQKVMIPKAYSAADAYALQTALIADGVFPPEGKDGHECQRTGAFDACTVAALEGFQTKHGITGEKGYAGKGTLAKLNAVYSDAKDLR